MAENAAAGGEFGQPWNTNLMNNNYVQELMVNRSADDLHRDVQPQSSDRVQYRYSNLQIRPVLQHKYQEYSTSQESQEWPCKGGLTNPERKLTWSQDQLYSRQPPLQSVGTLTREESFAEHED